MESAEYIAAILKTDKDIIRHLNEWCSARSGKTGVLDAVLREDQELMRSSLEQLGVDADAPLRAVVDALENKVRFSEQELQRKFGTADFTDVAFGSTLLETAVRMTAPKPGLFLKKEKAQELIRRAPPQHIMAHLGYDSADAMLAKEDVMQVYAALRFGETNEWLTQVFFKQYEALQPSDFETRPLTTAVLDARFAPLAKEFIEKKYHNVSHLKELGMLFIIPTAFNQSGQLIKIFSLLFHYCYEIRFYADLMEAYAANPGTFARNIISLFRGDVPEPGIDLGACQWLVVQRYLEKQDQNDLLLMVPHVNPESLHWMRAQNDIAKMSPGLAFWNNLDWVGGFLKDEIGADVLVTFNLVDIAMMLSDKDKGKKYVYHQREALWNKLFTSYFGIELMEKSMKDNMLGGVIQW